MSGRYSAKAKAPKAADVDRAAELLGRQRPSADDLCYRAFCGHMRALHFGRACITLGCHCRRFVRGPLAKPLPKRRP